MKSPEHAPGFCFCIVVSSGGDFSLAEARHLRGEFVVPCDELRMILAPCAAEAQVAIPEHASDRDLSDRWQRADRRRRRFERGEPARDFTLLPLDPGLHLLVGRTEAIFV